MKKFKKIGKFKNKLLVVGGTGFIGSHVVKKAIEDGYDVTILSKKKIKAQEKKINVKYITADIQNKKQLLNKTMGKNFNHVINLGGYVDHSIFSLGGSDTFQTHFIGTMNLVKCLNKKSLLNFIQIGSSDEYGLNDAPQVEDQREMPISPYSCAKVASTHLLQTLYRTQKFPVKILRLFLVYGAGQNVNRLIPQVIAGCKNKKSFPVSHGDQIRDFCYIDDVVTAILIALKNKKIYGEVINIASGKATKIKNLIQKIIKIVGNGKADFGKKKYRKMENMKLYADVSKAKNLMKWKAKIKLDQGLKLIIKNI